MKRIPSSFEPSWIQISISFLVVIYIAINVFRIGGDGFVLNLNNNISNPLALGVTVLAFMSWRQFAVTGKNRLLWSGLTLGWAFWTIAEFWWGIAAFINNEIPYPSGADFFWIAGYIPMFIALWERARSLPRKVGLWQKAGIWLSILLSVAGTIWFVLIPIVQESDSTAILESALGISYPLADLFLLILVSRIFFTYRQGLYGYAWRWLSIGFVIVSISDLIFLYASTAGLYYPNGQANLISTLGVEVPYNLSYLFWFIGLYIVRTIQNSHQTFTDTHIPLKLVPNTHLLVFTKEDDLVTSVSRNYSHVYPLQIVEGKTVSDVLGSSPDDAESVLRNTKANKILMEQAIQVNTRSGPQQALVSGISTANLQDGNSGVILLLRMLTEDYFLDDLMTDYHHGMVRSLLDKTGTKEKEEKDIKQLLSNYYLSFLRAYYNHIFSEGGSIMADTFLTELQSVVKLHEWQIGIRPPSLLDTSALSLEKTREALPVLSETARQFVISIADEATANTISENVRSHYDEPILKNISHFEKAKAEHP